MSRAFVIALVLLAPVMGGCLDWVPSEIRDPISKFIDDFTPGPGTVFATDFVSGDWNHDGRFTARVVHTQALSIAVSVKDADGVVTEVLVDASNAEFDADAGTWTTEIEAEIDDGVWRIVLTVDGKIRKEWNDVWIDAHPPQVAGLERVGKASSGRYIIGSAATWETGATVQLIDPEGQVIAATLPFEVSGLGDGLHAYTVLFMDAAGHQVVRTVQVLAGDAKQLPEGEHTVGIVARYTNAVRVWDISRPADYMMPAEAAAAQPGYLGSGFGITPNDPEVQAVVDEVVTESMTTMDAAMALFEWLYDNLEYTEERLEEDDLLTPSQTFANEGGVCRDLAAAYVSLLRAAGVPARLVTGYLAGGIDGFHAWVEFYAGTLGDQGAWVPVDVSSIDGRWDEPTDPNDPDSLRQGTSTMLQSFGVRLPNYLPLRALPADAEKEGWATAISVSYSYSSGSDAPKFDYEKAIIEQADENGYLCVNSESLARLASHDQQSCQGGPYNFVIGSGAQPFVMQSTQVIDYGVAVESASPSTTVTVALAIPFTNEITPVVVEYITYTNHEDSPAFGNAKDGKRAVTMSY